MLLLAYIFLMKVPRVFWIFSSYSVFVKVLRWLIMVSMISTSDTKVPPTNCSVRYYLSTASASSRYTLYYCCCSAAFCNYAILISIPRGFDEKTA